jgi:hypothetical protein
MPVTVCVPYSLRSVLAGERPPTFEESSEAHCEAETVARLCCAALKLPGVQASGGYIEHWWGPGKITKWSAQRILKVVDQILNAGKASGQGKDHP